MHVFGQQRTTSVLAIQRVMAGATPSAWRDGIVAEVDGESVVIAFLDGAIARLQIIGHSAETATGEPVAFHPVAEILSAGGELTTARP